MLKENASLTLEIQKIIDIAITGVSFIAAYFIRKNLLPGSLSSLSTDPNYYIVLLLIIISWYIAFKWMGMYMSYRQQSFWNFFATTLKSCFLGMVLVSIAMYLMHIQGVSRLLMGIFFILNLCLLTLSKFIIFKVLEKIRADGFNTRNILIIGSKDRACQVIEAVESNKASGYRILGAFDIDRSNLGKFIVNGHKVIGLIENLENYLRNNIVDELIFAMPLKKIENGSKYITLAENMGINVRMGGAKNASAAPAGKEYVELLG